MPDHESPPPLISELCALARDQLKTQAARSTALEAKLALIFLALAVAVELTGALS